MIFHEVTLPGAYVVELERHADDRGFFARTWCRDTFAKHGLTTEFAQCSVSYNIAAGTVRGLHYQDSPHWEAKLVQCLRGAVYDVIVDLRENAPTFGQWFAVELTAENGRMLYIPEQFAHGFQTLLPDTEVSYMMSTPYVPEAARGIRYDDPTLAIPWPLPVQRISARDRALPSFDQLPIFSASRRKPHAIAAHGGQT